MIIDQYELSPIQEGMLFHHIAGGHPGVDVEQLVIDYEAPVDLDALERAWQFVTARHPAMRTSFRWEGVAQPLQIVHEAVSLSLARHGNVDDQSFARFLAGDRLRGFDLTHPPLMRLTVFGSKSGRLRVVWTLHHILMDGRSFVLVLQEVDETYRRIAEGRPVPLTTGLPYKPYVQWTRGLDLEGAPDYWRKKLGGLSGPTPLPPEVGHLEQALASNGETEFQLGEQLTARLRRVAEQHEVTLNTVFMAVWAVVLARFSGESDVLFGATKTTRRSSVKDADTTVGLFLNTVPVRIRIEPNATIPELLKQVRSEWLSLRQYEYTPLVNIKQATAFIGPMPLFDSLVVFENSRFDTALQSSGPTWQGRRLQWFEQTNFALTLLAYGDPSLFLKLEFDAGRYSLETARRIMAYVVQAFQSIVETPAATLADLTVIPREERSRLINQWNGTGVEYPRETPLAELIERQVLKNPRAVAIVFGDQSLTYKELNDRANQFARELVKNGAGPDGLVGIFLERSLDMMVALLAIVKAGAAYLPMDPNLPRSRLEHMLKDSGLGIVVTQVDLVASLPGFAGAIVHVDTDDWRSNESENLGIVVKPMDLAYVIYTSGSTGKPKGVQVTRGALLNLLYSVSELLKFTSADRLLALTTISFDIAGADIWMPWLVGAKTILASREAAGDGSELQRLITRHDITFLQATPVTWWLLLGAGWPGKSDLQIVCTGEALPTTLAVQLKPLVRRLWNLYGPTETTIWSTAYLLDQVAERVLIGRPLANTQCYILDEQRQPVPIGATGELYIAGDGLARGYLNQPELTAAKFVANPFVDGSESRMYRTGDLARYLSDGNIECLGRTDHQVKIRGFRIELGEIETALKQHPSIRQAVVIAREDVPGDKRLVAYVLPSAGSTVERTELRELLKRQLPEYMVPADYVTVESIPISPNGKIDRNALPAPTQDIVSQEVPLSHAYSGVEREVLRIFSQVLNVPRLSINDDFFDLGGHSLNALRVISMVNTQFSLDFPVRVLFQAQTPAAIARLIEARLENQSSLEQWSALIPIQPNGTRSPLFCIARPNVNALGYLFLSRQLNHDQPAYGLQKQMAEDPEIDFTQEQYATTAAEYIQAIRSVQPVGPYCLIGQCQGAYIAFEMTRQLEAGGEQVSLLGMLDVWPEENTRHKWVFLAHLFLARCLEQLRRRRSDSGSQDGHLPPAPRELWDSVETSATGHRMWQKYWPGASFNPPTVHAPITVFRVHAQSLYRIRDEALGWAKWTTGGVAVVRIPGTHLTFLREPHVNALARALTRRLADAASNNSVRTEAAEGITA